MKFKWFWRWIKNKLVEINSENQLQKEAVMYNPCRDVLTGCDSRRFTNFMNVNVEFGIGGVCVRLSTDTEERSRLYVISDDKEFNTELAEIISMERIRMT